MTERVKAITLTQPWATLMVATTPAIPRPLKPFETRNFAIGELPQRVAIHAGKGDAGMRQHIVHPQYHRFREPYAGLLNSLGYSSRDPWWKQWTGTREVTPDGRELIMVPLASVVGLVRFIECVSTNDVPRADWIAADPVNFALGNYDPNRYAWQADRQLALPRPVPCSGAQGFWYLPDDIAALVLSQ